jgi:hypothetical protein
MIHPKTTEITRLRATELDIDKYSPLTMAFAKSGIIIAQTIARTVLNIR